MRALERLKPRFWNHVDAAAGPRRTLFNFRRMWILAVSLTSAVALIPLIVMAVIDYGMSQKSVESENLLQTARLVSNTRRSITFFLRERKSALDFIVKDNDFEALNDREHLSRILENLKGSFGGFADLGVIDPMGYQRTYVGPYDLEGVDYSDQAWYRQVVEKGVYISDVFLGFRHAPHLVIAVKHEMANGLCYVLRAALDTERFIHLLSDIEMRVRTGDTFLINQEGVLQTPSKFHGKVFGKVALPVPPYSSKTEVFETEGVGGTRSILGYAYIQETPFVLLIVKDKSELMEPWHETQMQLAGFLAFSIALILFVILGVATYLVNRIHVADQKRLMMLHQIEYSNKMASIGRLAAGVAHEINNPLAVINEKAGLIKDLFTLKREYGASEKLMGLVDSILKSVERCAGITRRLLSFVRHTDETIQSLQVKDVITEVLSFLGKEAEYRSIVVSVRDGDGVPPIESHRGRLQEIFLNVINNAFAAMVDGGHLEITLERGDPDGVSVTIADDGCGIPPEDLERIFEPFFSTRTNQGGTGLGLSITSGLVQGMGGRIRVQSGVGKGTRFTITLPPKMQEKREDANESTACG